MRNVIYQAMQPPRQAVVQWYIHVCSGMLARGEELCVLRWANTAAVQRNIFVYQSQIMLIFSYKQVGRRTIRLMLFELRGHYPSIWPKLGPSAISSVVN
jgi:hypothetical protein